MLFSLILALAHVWHFVRVTVGGPLFGYVCGKLTTFWLSRIFNDAITEITITLAATYVTFYVGKISKIISCVSVLSLKAHKSGFEREKCCEQNFNF